MKCYFIFTNFFYQLIVDDIVPNATFLYNNEYNLNSRCRYIYINIFIGQGEH